jgi:hypothetical protein
MARCNQCGAELPDYYTSCPNCGGQVSAAAPQPQPQPYAQPTGGYVPMSEQRVITSVGGWFGWYLLCCVLPIIGPIIIMNCSKDPTAKNFGKLMLILEIIGIVLVIALGAVLIPAMIGYIRKADASIYSGYGMMFLSMFIH